MKEGRSRILTHPSNLDYLLRRRTEFLRRHLRPGDRVLEVGAGLGIAGLYVEGLRLTSTDLHREPWLHAVADAMRLPFRGESFDAVVCLNMLHHLPHPRQCIEEMVRVLRAGGLLLIAEPHASLMMRFVVKLTGHEYVDRNVDPFGLSSCQTSQYPGTNGNNAIGDLLFGNFDRFRQAFPSLHLEEHRLSECLMFLNSGGVGFQVPCLPLPQFTLKLIGKLDDWLVRYPRLFPLCQEVVLRKNDTEGCCAEFRG